MAALCARIGLGERYIEARWPDDLAWLEAIAREAWEQDLRLSKTQAKDTAEAVRKMLDGK